MRETVKGFCSSDTFDSYKTLKHMHTFTCSTFVCLCVCVELCQCKRNISWMFVEVKPVGGIIVKVSSPFPHRKLKLPWIRVHNTANTHTHDQLKVCIYREILWFVHFVWYTEQYTILPKYIIAFGSGGAIHDVCLNSLFFRLTFFFQKKNRTK